MRSDRTSRMPTTWIKLLGLRRGWIGLLGLWRGRIGLLGLRRGRIWLPGLWRGRVKLLGLSVSLRSLSVSCDLSVSAFSLSPPIFVCLCVFAFSSDLSAFSSDLSVSAFSDLCLLSVFSQPPTEISVCVNLLGRLGVLVEEINSSEQRKVHREIFSEQCFDQYFE